MRCRRRQAARGSHRARRSCRRRRSRRSPTSTTRRATSRCRPSGRVFFTLHPDGKPPMKVVELVDGKPVPYPDAAFQQPSRARRTSSRRSRCASTGRTGSGCSTTPTTRAASRASLAFDLATNQLVHQYDFPSDGRRLPVDAERLPGRSRRRDRSTSPSRARSGRRPALVVYDVEHKTSRRAARRPSVGAGRGLRHEGAGPRHGRLGVYTLRIGVDSIALDAAASGSTTAPVNGDRMYRVRTARSERRVALARRRSARRSRTTARRRSATASPSTTPATSTSPTPSTRPSLTLGPDRHARRRWSRTRGCAGPTASASVPTAGSTSPAARCSTSSSSSAGAQARARAVPDLPLQAGRQRASPAIDEDFTAETRRRGDCLLEMRSEAH